MSHATRVSAYGRHAGAFLLHFAHGGLVVAGLIVTVFVGVRFADQGLSGLSMPGLFGRAEVAAQQDAAPAVQVAEADAAEAPAEPAPAATATHLDRLSPEMGRVSEYLSRRYKVSRAAIEPLIRSALATGRSVGLDPVLIIAVMGVESSFNPFAESSFGAQGLMQVVPRFHKDKIDPSAGAHPLLDPNENIRVGALVLKEYIRRNGSLTAGLQQYGGDPSSAYANRVLAEAQRLKTAMKSGPRLASAS